MKIISAITKTISSIFYCDITDHLPCFISISRDPRFHLNKRPYTGIFGETNCAVFRNKMESNNWEGIFENEDEDWYAKFISIVLRFYETSFPSVQVSRKRLKDKPWLILGLKISTQTKNKTYRLSLKTGTKYVERFKKYKNEYVLTKRKSDSIMRWSKTVKIHLQSLETFRPYYKRQNQKKNCIRHKTNNNWTYNYKLSSDIGRYVWYDQVFPTEEISTKNNNLQDCLTHFFWPP